MDTQTFPAPAATAAPRHRLTNGRYEVLIAPTGAGRSSWNGIALTRSRDDPLLDDLGTLVYLRDLDSGAFWSLGHQPTRAAPERYGTDWADGRFVLEREDLGIVARLELTLDPGADLERRLVRLINRSPGARRIEVTSYLEPVLFPAAADAAHPAFAKLFVQTARDPDTGALLAHRRPRGADESWPWLVHALTIGAAGRDPGSDPGRDPGRDPGSHPGDPPTEWETDRLAFLGRGGTPARPLALCRPGPLAGTLGNVLDPILCLRRVVRLAPGGAAELTLLTGAAPDRAGALALAAAAGARGDGPGAAAPLAAPGPGAPRPDPLPAGSPAGSAGPGPADLCHWNGYGGFSPDGREYVVRLPWTGDGHRRPPLPWINVIANPRCGLLVSESGAGYAWARNSQANRLTPWSNDPASDPHGDALYLRDESAGTAWSPLPGPLPAPADYLVRHGLGYSVFACAHGGIRQETTVFVPREDPLRICRLRLANPGTSPRTLTVFGYRRLVMASQPQAASPILTAFDAGLDLLRATNPQAGDFADGIVFACAWVEGATLEDRAYTADRLAFLGPQGDPGAPAALVPGARLEGRWGAGLDPCFAEAMRIVLAPGASADCVFLLGEAVGESELTALARRYRAPGAVAAALEEARAFWTDLAGRLQVATPAPAIDRMVNGWLLYQTLGCRLWARSAFYQSGGAYGYRDQLQDAAALATVRPDLTRSQILLHAGHQFLEGDVLHWWHPEPLERGLRTRFSDDLLWLPYATAHYVRTTGDRAILDEPVPFLSADPLAPGQDEAYLRPSPSGEVADLYAHCCRALDRSLTRGAHGLPLMGTGDWNDGMNRVGREGRGESVWLGFFLHRILADFLPLCTARGDRERALRYRTYQEDLALALESGGWDGAWYRRAYYDDGTPLGSADQPAGDPECRIDALVQSWAALSGAVPRGRAEQALDALETHLIREEERLIPLLAPPFRDTPRDPGYIKGYVAGVRENGGQYTHAACWTVLAMAKLGRRERAARLLAMLSPVSHTDTPGSVERYRLEPYAVAADVYGAPPHVGRGGWSWYTGSAGWWLRVALEGVLGIQVEDGRSLVIRPCIPADWPGFRLSYRLPDGATRCEIEVANPVPGAGTGAVTAARLDGAPLAPQDGAVRVVLPAAPGTYRIQVVLG